MATPAYSSRISPVKNNRAVLLARSYAPGDIGTTQEITSSQLLRELDNQLTGGATATIRQAVTNYTADGALTKTSGLHTISKTGSAAAMTISAPSAINGTRLTVISTTAFAHVITFTGATLLDGTTGANLTVTMTAFPGSALTIIAYGATWLLESSSNVTSITA